MESIKIHENVELRPLTYDTEDEEYRLLMDNYDYFSQWIFWLNKSFTKQNLHDDLGDALRDVAQHKMYLMGVYVGAELVGAVDVRDIVPGKSAEVGYFIAEKFTGQGLASTCMLKLIEYAHDRHDIPYFFLMTLVDNAASSRVAEKMGFVLEKIVATNGVKEKRFGKSYT